MRHDHPRERFRNKLARECFEHPRAIVVEKIVSAEINHQLHIHTAFETCGWVPILQHGNVFYPNLCKEFYANLRTRLGSLTITTRVASFDSTLSTAALGEILGVPSDIPVTNTENIVDLDYRGWDEACITLKILHIKRNEDRQKDSLRINLAKPRVCVLQFLLAKNVTPKSSNYGEARHLDIYHL